jgi:hypothetical protein
VYVVGYLACGQAVQEVAGRAAQDEAARQSRQPGALSGEEHPEDDPDRHGATDQEQHLAPAEDAERAAGVPDIGDAQEARYHGDALPGAHRALYDGLQTLVEDEDRQREPQSDQEVRLAAHSSLFFVMRGMFHGRIVAHARPASGP